MSTLSQSALEQLAENIKAWGKALGFQQLGIADVNLQQHEAYLQRWLDRGFHGEMQFMQAHGNKRSRPEELLPGTVRVISVRMDYLPPDAQFAQTLKYKDKAYISRYAGGRDYHKLLRSRLKKLGEQIRSHCEALQFRPFVDSAPVLEHALAEKAGIGWTGKHSLTINKEAGSWFFLGELFIDLPLPIDKPVEEGCGECTACITICPTNAIVEPYVVDARRCISYLTIELQDEIPAQFRPLIGNRVYGCDDCQLICPWNRYAQITAEDDFHTRQSLKNKDLLELFRWDEATFLKNTEGSAIRRIGHERWLRNIATALGNCDYSADIVTELENRRDSASQLVRVHIDWAIAQQNERLKALEKQIPISEDRTKARLIRSVEKGLPRDA